MRKRIQVPVSTYSLNMETYAETSTRNKRLCSPQRRGRKDHLCKNIERTSGGLELASPFRAFSSISGGWRGQLAEDFPGNLCPDRAQPRHASPPRFTTSPSTRVHFPTRISTRTNFVPKPSQPNFPTALYRRTLSVHLTFDLIETMPIIKYLPMYVYIYISVDISTRLSTRTFIWRIFIGNSRFSLEIPLCNKRSRPPRSGRTLFRVSFGLVDPKCSAVFHVSTFII